MVKLDVDTLPTVPAAPPAAGPDRALDPPPPDPGPPAALLLLPGTDCADVAEGDDEAKLTESPITAHISAAQAATIHRLLLFDSNRRTHGRRACPGTVTEADESGAAPAPATGGSDVALETGRAGRVSWRLVAS
jgi:hypothetical protein